RRRPGAPGPQDHRTHRDRTHQDGGPHDGADEWTPHLKRFFPEFTMSGFKAMLAASMVLALGGCALMGEPPEHVSYQRRPVSFSPTAARDWLDQYRESKGLSSVAIDPRL